MSLSIGTPALSPMKLREKGSERSLESMLQARKQKVSAIERLLRGADSPSSRDPLVPVAIPGSNHLSLQDSILADPTFVSIARSSTRNGSSSLTEVINSNFQYVGGHTKYDNLASDSLSSFSLPYMVKRHAERALLDGSTVERNIDLSFKKLSNMHLDRQLMDAANKNASFRGLNNNYQATGRVSASRGCSFDDNQSHLSEVSNYVDGPTSLGDALSEGLCSSSDLVARVSAFNYLRNLLQQWPRGIQEVTQNFEKVMKLFFRHLDDPRHKIIPPCRKPFESYLERILPYVFSRLIDPKELVRQPCMTNLEIINRTYGIDSLLPALLRSLDEQRSPIAKLVVVEFANNSFDNHSPNPDGYSNEASISGIIYVYTHDSATVLNFILSLSIEEQNLLRRSLKQFTPRIEVDLVNVLQSKKERQRSKAVYDPADVIGTSSDDGYNGLSKKSQLLGKYLGGSLDVDGGKKWDSMQESILVDALIAKTASDETRQTYHNLEPGSDNEVLGPHSKDLRHGTDVFSENTFSWINRTEKPDSLMDYERNMRNQQLEITQMIGSDSSKDIGPTFGGEDCMIRNSFMRKLLHQSMLKRKICSISGEKSSRSKHEALHKLVGASIANYNSVWAKGMYQASYR
ncbi:hypothetical protein KFK09_004869 [Dendrobium nobile]|uniref:Uncharacterized protein n=1 Tax=Dendrobium nobile TaxID=94219 RepID=A0A8T3BU52_DENNO|nr:hypothetical protein KFK09_004869 [Dendrobium nobile]